jgi:hypothetical protein
MHLMDVVGSDELNRRRCAEEVATAVPDCVCPISCALMRDPMTAADHHSYERQEIERWFAGGSVKSPLTEADLPNTTLSPTFTLNKAIESALEAKMDAAASPRCGRSSPCTWGSSGPGR